MAEFMYCVVDSDDDETDIQLANDQIVAPPKPSNQATQRHTAPNVVAPENGGPTILSATDPDVAGPSNQATQRHTAPNVVAPANGRSMRSSNLISNVIASANGRSMPSSANDSNVAGPSNPATRRQTAPLIVVPQANGRILRSSARQRVSQRRFSINSDFEDSSRYMSGIISDSDSEHSLENLGQAIQEHFYGT